MHSQSNHPPSILKNIPESVNKRLSNISSNKKIFDEASPPYQEALQKSGYNYKLKHEPLNKQGSNSNRKRTRNVTWFNPPYSENVATNIGRKFFHLLDRSFPPGHKLHRLLNRNTVKLSYSCMPNIKSIITMHNKSTLAKCEPKQNVSTRNDCNCRKSEECPLQNKCQTKGIIYQATVTRQDNMTVETYKDLRQIALNHVSTIITQILTTLSKEMLQLWVNIFGIYRTKILDTLSIGKL